MRKILYILTALMVLAVFPAAAQEAASDGATITLERTACFGMCPVYTVTLHEDGTVVYNGDQHVDVEGEQTINIGTEAFDELMQVIEDAGYFEWDDEYKDMTITDQSYVTTSVTRDGETKTIEHYLGDESAPLVLGYLENWIDRVALTQQWTGSESPTPFTSRALLPLITLERTPCFGFCPVYSVTVYGDGTVIFSGYNHVGEMGIHMGSIEPEAVTELAQSIMDAGYFDLAPEYTNIDFTDQSTVITSVSSEDGYNRVVHYLGDESAPDALTEIEDMIDAAANTAQWIDMPDAEATPEVTETP